ncbi:MAG TPA: hypothetical protein VMM38_04790 [Aridibacter sp.]|nr:hypothetical protein [Aridibacter sp.]
MRPPIILSVLFLGIACVGCDTKGEPVAYDKACSLGNDGRTIETKGFLDDAGGVFCSDTSGRMECGMKLKAKADDKTGFTADIALGSGANTMDELPRGYQKTDIVIRHNEGGVVDLGKEVTVTGKLSAYQSTEAPGGVGCFVKVYKIEQK